MHPKFGKYIASCPLKDNTVLEAYLNGNMLYFVIGNEIHKSLHVDDVAEVMAGLLGIQDGKSKT